MVCGAMCLRPDGLLHLLLQLNRPVACCGLVLQVWLWVAGTLAGGGLGYLAMLNGATLCAVCARSTCTLHSVQMVCIPCGVLWCCICFSAFLTCWLVALRMLAAGHLPIAPKIVFWLHVAGVVLGCWHAVRWRAGLSASTPLVQAVYMRALLLHLSRLTLTLADGKALGSTHSCPVTQASQVPETHAAASFCRCRCGLPARWLVAAWAISP
jgi:hypothetical protein